MNMSQRTHKLVLSAVIAALYVALTFMQEFIIPGSGSMAVQFRVSEALTVLSLFTPAAIPGLTIGCFIANFSTVGALPVDIIFGTGASFLACYFMHRFKDITFKGVPFLSLFMPALFNGIIIGAEIEIFFIEGSFNFISFIIQAGLVALGEVLVLYTLGLIIYRVIIKRGFYKYFGNY